MLEQLPQPDALFVVNNAGPPHAGVGPRRSLPESLQAELTGIGVSSASKLLEDEGSRLLISSTPMSRRGPRRWARCASRSTTAPSTTFCSAQVSVKMSAFASATSRPTSIANRNVQAAPRNPSRSCWSTSMTSSGRPSNMIIPRGQGPGAGCKGNAPGDTRETDLLARNGEEVFALRASPILWRAQSD